MKIKTSGTIKNYRSSPITGNLLTVSVSKDLAESLDSIGSKPIGITISTVEETRSKNANAYMWELLTELSKAGYGNAIELYRSYIREYGRSDFLRVPREAFEYYASNFMSQGIGFQIERTGDSTWANEGGEEIETIEFIQYYGSHAYSKEEMGRLIDAIVQDCKAVGIDTDPAFDEGGYQ